MLAQAHCALAVFGYKDEEVDGAADGGETEESKGEGVGPDVLGAITSQDAERRDGCSGVTERDLESGTNATPQVSTDFSRWEIR